MAKLKKTNLLSLLYTSKVSEREDVKFADNFETLLKDKKYNFIDEMINPSPNQLYPVHFRLVDLLQNYPNLFISNVLKYIMRTFDHKHSIDINEQKLSLLTSCFNTLDFIFSVIFLSKFKKNRLKTVPHLEFWLTMKKKRKKTAINPKPRIKDKNLSFLKKNTSKSTKIWTKE